MDVQKTWMLLDAYHKAQGLPQGLNNIKRAIEGELQKLHEDLSGPSTPPQPAPTPRSIPSTSGSVRRLGDDNGSDS